MQKKSTDLQPTIDAARPRIANVHRIAKWATDNIDCQSRKMKPTPRNAANTIVPAYLALLERVLLVSRETSLMTDSGGLWIAENSNHQFKADDWVTLLGLVALQETRGPNWPASDQQFEQFLSQFGVP